MHKVDGVDPMSSVLARVGISILFLGALVIQVLAPGRLDTIAVVLLVLVELPWAAPSLERPLN
jgi:hypothetical protein